MLSRMSLTWAAYAAQVDGRGGHLRRRRRWTSAVTRVPPARPPDPRRRGTARCPSERAWGRASVPTQGRSCRGTRCPGAAHDARQGHSLRPAIAFGWRPGHGTRIRAPAAGGRGDNTLDHSSGGNGPPDHPPAARRGTASRTRQAAACGPAFGPCAPARRASVSC